MPHTVPLSFATLLPAPRGYQCPFILCRVRQATEAGSGKREGEAVQPANPGTCLCRAPQKKKEPRKWWSLEDRELLFSTGMNDTWTILYSKGKIKCRRETETVGQREAGLVGL